MLGQCGAHLLMMPAMLATPAMSICLLELILRWDVRSLKLCGRACRG